MIKKRIHPPFLFLLALLFFSNTGQAQNAYHKKDILVSLDSLNFPTVQLGEVVIKSAREQRPLQELPISTSLIAVDQIEQEQVTGLTDLTSRVPNLYMPSYGSKLTTPIYIRGIGSRINSPAVGLYVDDVPQFDKSSFDFEFYNIERVEVLRGPQGTMYGRNNMGGLIHVYTQSPEDNQNIKAQIEMGNYGRQNYGLTINQPLGEKTDFQIGGQYRHQDGFFENIYTGKMADKMDAYNGRARVIHRWSEQFKTDVIVSTENSEQNGYPYGVIDPETNELQPVNYNETSGYDRNLATMGIVNTWERGKIIIKSVTSGQYIDEEQTIDQDFTPDPRYIVAQPQTQHILTQEITATLEGNRIETVFGAFGFLHTLEKNVRVGTGENYSTQIRKDYEHSNAGMAVFAQSTVKDIILEGLSFTSGVRIDWEKATQDYYYDIIRNDTIFPVDSTDSELKFSEILPRITLDYQISDALNIYASLTKGYKTGGFNSTFERPQDQTFEPEHSCNYEAGLKSKWVLNLLRFSITGFYIDWKNQQIYQPVPSGRGSMLKNAGRSESKGLEGELTIRPNNILETTINTGYTEATFLEYQKNDSTDLSGNYLPYAPRVTLYAGQNIHIPINNQLLDKALININYQGTGKLYWDEENNASQDYYGMWNASVTLERKNVSLSFRSKNIFNKDYQVFRFSALGNNYAQRGIPANFSVQMKATF
jgi:iron complex outermembrane receptor protein